MPVYRTVYIFKIWSPTSHPQMAKLGVGYGERRDGERERERERERESMSMSMSIMMLQASLGLNPMWRVVLGADRSPFDFKRVQDVDHRLLFLRGPEQFPAGTFLG